MTEHQQTAAAIVRHHLKTPEERIAVCDRNIAAALLESGKSHSQAEHLQILLWEVDQRQERQRLLEELGRESA